MWRAPPMSIVFVVERGLPARWCDNVEALDDHANHRRVMLRISIGRFAGQRCTNSLAEKPEPT